MATKLVSALVSIQKGAKTLNLECSPNELLLFSLSDLALTAHLTVYSVLASSLNDDEAGSLRKALIENSTLTNLHLSSEFCLFPLEISSQSMMCGCLDNNIGDGGARALAESLKVNSTLTNLDLTSACSLFPHDML